MGMTIEEICYRLRAMATMCIFKDAVGCDLSQKEIKLYNQANDEAIDIMRKYQKIEEIVKNTQQLCSYGSAFIDIREVVEDGNK